MSFFRQSRYIWRSKKQNVVTKSGVEAEFRVMAMECVRYCG